jgi:hypothetical protein
VAERYLLETSAVDGYLLEDGSGVVLKESMPGVSAGVATVAGALIVQWALKGASAGVATVSGTLINRRAVLLTQEVVESDVLQTDRLRELSQQLVEVTLDRGSLDWKLMQLVIEVDGDNWGFVTGRILSGQFV